MNHFIKACLVVLSLSLSPFDASAASPYDNSNTPVLINTDGCKATISAPSWVCIKESFNAHVSIVLEYGNPHTANYPVTISGSAGATVTPTAITYCPAEVDLACFSGNGTGGDILTIKVGAVSSFPISVIDFSRTSGTTQGGPITAQVVSNSQKDFKHDPQTVEMGVFYQSSSDKCSAKYVVRDKISFTGVVIATARPGGFLVLDHARSEGWAKGQVFNDLVVDLKASAASSESSLPLTVPLPGGGSLSIPIGISQMDSVPVFGVGHILTEGTHEPGTEINFTRPVTVQAAGLTDADGDASASFTVFITAAHAAGQDDLIVFSSAH